MKFTQLMPEFLYQCDDQLEESMLKFNQGFMLKYYQTKRTYLAIVICRGHYIMVIFKVKSESSLLLDETLVTQLMPQLLLREPLM